MILSEHHQYARDSVACWRGMVGWQGGDWVGPKGDFLTEHSPRRQHRPGVVKRSRVITANIVPSALRNYWVACHLSLKDLFDF
jgi:hypothetical protein